MSTILCQKCGVKKATVFYRESQNGREREYHLCADCAREMGVGAMPQDLFSAFPLFSPFSQSGQKEEERCPLCKTSLSSIRKNAAFGCSRCYDTFAHLLDMTPFVGSGYQGKAPEKAAGTQEKVQAVPDEKTKAPTLDSLKKELKKAIEAEEYERAALLRDQIREKEGK